MDHQKAYELPFIPAVSPSLAERLRVCPLQAGISRIENIRAYVLANPKAWLGTAYHSVLEHLWQSSPLGDDALIEELWSKSIKTLQIEAAAHPLNRRFTTAEKWPGYYLVRAFTVVRGKEALREKSKEERAIPANSRVFREQKFSAMNGKLVGKPDVIYGSEIRDYKSGRVYEDTDDGTLMIKRTYVRQLRLYGRLVEESLGWCPSKGILLPMDGEAVEIPLDSQACAAEAAEAISLLNTYNERVKKRPAVIDLATPSPSACGPCEYKGLCPAFWENVDAGQWEQWLKFFLRGVAEVAEEATMTARKIVQLRESHRKLVADNLGRSTARALGLLESLYRQPIVSMSNISDICGLTFQGASDMAKQFSSLGILKETTGRKRNRLFAYARYLSLLGEPVRNRRKPGRTSLPKPPRTLIAGRSQDVLRRSVPVQ